MELTLSASQKLSTEWIPTATIVVTNTYTATRVEEILTDTPPYAWTTTFPITFTQTETETEYMSIVTSVPDKRAHVRDFHA